MSYKKSRLVAYGWKPQVSRGQSTSSWHTRYLLQRTAHQSCTFLTPSLKYRLEVGDGYGGWGGGEQVEKGTEVQTTSKYLGWIRLSMSMFSWVCLQVLPPHVCTRFANIYSVFLVMEWTRGTSKSRGVALSPLPHSDHKGSHFLCWAMGSGWWEVRRFLWRRFYRLRFFCDFFFPSLSTPQFVRIKPSELFHLFPLT